MFKLGVALLFCLGGPALAQDLVAIKPLATVDDPALRLGDVFDNVGPRAAQGIGAAPLPGRRLVLDVGQLVTLARGYGLAWRPLSENDRVVVERAGRSVPREDIEAALRGDLVRLGVPADSLLELGPWLPPMVPPAALVELTTEAVSVEGGTGRFAATLVVAAQGIATQRQRISGRAVPTVAVTVATHRLALGDIIGPGDVRSVRLRAERVRLGVAERPEQAIGQQLKRPIGTDLPIQLADLAPPSLVLKNTLVTLLLDAPGLSLSAQGRALDSAPRGATVRVMNLNSQSVVEGQVIGAGRVRVTIGTTPLARAGE
jgi:flagella basal body P-ring formation protein FlgA